MCLSVIVGQASISNMPYRPHADSVYTGLSTWMPVMPFVPFFVSYFSVV